MTFCLSPLQNHALAAPANNSDDVWKMEQNNKLFGAVTALVAPDAVRYDMKRLQLTLVCAAPKWDVCLYSQARKLEWRCDFEKFRTKGFGSFLAARGVKSLPAGAKGETTVFGVKCATLRYEASKNKGVLPSLYGIYYGKKEKAVDHEYLDLVYLVERYPLQVNVCLCELADIPVVGVPLTAYSDIDGKLIYVLKTKGVTKCAMDRGLFAYPSGYKQSATADPLLTIANSKQATEDAFGPLFEESKKK